MTFIKGHPQFNTGKTHFKKGNHPKTEFKKGITPWNLGKKCPQLSGKNNANWKGGKLQSKTRWFILKPEHPSINSTGYIRRSRLVAEKCLGRYLTKMEVIHHINEDKSDDRPENLYLFSSFGKHKSYHNLKNKPILKSNLTQQASNHEDIPTGH